MFEELEPRKGYMVIAPAMPPAPRTIAAHDVTYPSTVAADAPLRPKLLTPPAMMAILGMPDLNVGITSGVVSPISDSMVWRLIAKL